MTRPITTTLCFAGRANSGAADHCHFGNPYENLGVSLAGDVTASLFYPGKLIFLLPFSFATAYKLYVALHLLIAAGWTYKLARCWRYDCYGAAAAAIGYAFGGYVLFQYCNVIYLVGAAWLPAALWTGDQTLRRKSWRWSIGLGVVLAMMVLGGDPQTAYHTGLLLFLYAIILGRRSASRARGWLLSIRTGLLLMGALIAVCLCAIQVAPSTAWTRHGDRYPFERPRSIYEVPAAWERAARDGKSPWQPLRHGLAGRSGHGTPPEHLRVQPGSLASFRGVVAQHFR